MDEAAAVLELLSKTNMNKNRIQELWKAYFVDQQVYEALVDLFSGGEPAKELVAAVRHRTNNLDLKDVRTSLTRVRARFEFPALRDPTVARPTPMRRVPQSTGLAHAPSQPEKVTRAEQALKLGDLISRGLLAPGVLLVCQREGHELPPPSRLTARSKSRVQPTRHLRLRGCRQAGYGRTALARERKGHRWVGLAWQMEDSAGSVVTLKELRRRAARQ